MWVKPCGAWPGAFDFRSIVNHRWLSKHCGPAHGWHGSSVFKCEQPNFSSFPFFSPQSQLWNPSFEVHSQILFYCSWVSWWRKSCLDSLKKGFVAVVPVPLYSEFSGKNIRPNAWCSLMFWNSSTVLVSQSSILHGVMEGESFLSTVLAIAPAPFTNGCIQKALLPNARFLSQRSVNICMSPSFGVPRRCRPCRWRLPAGSTCRREDLPTFAASISWSFD